jgi:protein-disulfide isomerase-like protein with CxxC motif
VEISPQQLEEAVVDASKRVATELAAKNRIRIVLYNFIAGALSASAIAIPTTLVLSHEAAATSLATSRQNSRTNCENITALAKVEQAVYVQQVISSKAFLHESKDRFGLSPSQFQKFLKQSQQQEKARSDQLLLLANVNCIASTR